jgi:hypothetical protein
MSRPWARSTAGGGGVFYIHLHPAQEGRWVDPRLAAGGRRNGEYLTNYMDQNPSWEADSHSASQEIPRLLWNPKVHYRVYKSTRVFPKVSGLSP